MAKYLISICGATGIGKTAWAIHLAQYLKTEIISADSRQFYREMRIGTAVPETSELQAVSHHFIQHKSIHEAYTVADFQKDALGLISELFQKYDHLILVGGSGLYLDAVTKGLDEFPEVKPGVREELEQQLEEKGITTLQESLSRLDPEYYQKVDLQNPRRLVRALEVCISSGEPYSSFLGKSKVPRSFKHIPLGIGAPREVIYKRIDERVDRMMEQGLLTEVKPLLPYRELSALQTVGYQELFAYLEGEVELEFAVETIKKNTRRFAKRQGTWFRKNTQICWIPFDATVAEGIQLLENQMNPKDEI